MRYWVARFPEVNYLSGRSLLGKFLCRVLLNTTLLFFFISFLSAYSTTFDVPDEAGYGAATYWAEINSYGTEYAGNLTPTGISSLRKELSQSFSWYDASYFSSGLQVVVPAPKITVVPTLVISDMTKSVIRLSGLFLSSYSFGVSSPIADSEASQALYSGGKPRLSTTARRVFDLKRNIFRLLPPIPFSRKNAYLLLLTLHLSFVVTGGISAYSADAPSDERSEASWREGVRIAARSGTISITLSKSYRQLVLLTPVSKSLTTNYI